MTEIAAQSEGAKGHIAAIGERESQEGAIEKMTAVRSVKRTAIVALCVVVAAVFTVPIALPTPAADAKAAPKLSKKAVTLTIGKTVTLKVKNKGKAKVTWKSSKKAVAKVSKKGKVTARKVGKATITAKVGKKKLKCKVTVKAAAKQAPAATTPAVSTPVVSPTVENNALGSRTNPAMARDGVTVVTGEGTAYLKLTGVKTEAETIAQLKAWGVWDEDPNYGDAEYYAEQKAAKNATIRMFTFDVKAVSGYTNSPLRCNTLFNYKMYNGEGTQSIEWFDGWSISGTPQTSMKEIDFLELFTGVSAQAYAVVYVPNGMTSFCNTVHDANYNDYWMKYTL